MKTGLGGDKQKTTGGNEKEARKEEPRSGEKKPKRAAGKAEKQPMSRNNNNNNNNKKKNTNQQQKKKKMKATSEEKLPSRDEDEDSAAPASKMKKKRSKEQQANMDATPIGQTPAATATATAAAAAAVGGGKKKRPEEEKKYVIGWGDDDEMESAKQKEERAELIKKWLVETTKTTPAQFAKEFKAVPSTAPDSECQCFLKNMKANRYDNIGCLDRTRFTLPGDEQFYIHANRVRVGSNEQRFVCTQGPMDNTIDDFWRMVLHLESASVIMLCGFVEDGAVKCSKYFCETVGTLELATLKVTTDSCVEVPLEESADKMYHRVLKVTVKTSGKETRINHFQWTTWPDQGMPDSCEPALKLLSAVRRDLKPITVHCSAGIGRTGTLVLVESIIVCLRFPKRHNVKEAFAQLRRDRSKSIQTLNQYIYAIRCVLEYLIMKEYMKASDPNWVKFKETYEKVRAKKPKQKAKCKRTLTQDCSDIAPPLPTPPVVDVITPPTPLDTTSPATPATPLTPIASPATPNTEQKSAVKSMLKSAMTQKSTLSSSSPAVQQPQ